MIHSRYGDTNSKRMTHLQTNKINPLGIWTIWTIKEIIRKRKRSLCIRRHRFSYVWPNRNFLSCPNLLLAAIFLWTEIIHIDIPKDYKINWIYCDLPCGHHQIQKIKIYIWRNIKCKKKKIVDQIIEFLDLKKKHILNSIINYLFIF